jgi:hypothetical protein
MNNPCLTGTEMVYRISVKCAGCGEEKYSCPLRAVTRVKKRLTERG